MAGVLVTLVAVVLVAVVLLVVQLFDVQQTSETRWHHTMKLEVADP